MFRIFFKDALESGGAFVIIDRKTQQIIGSTRFYGYDPEKSEIEIGWTFLARKYWGGRYNAEMKRLLLNHAFKFVESVVFFVGEDNVRSQKAMEKVGAIKVGTATRAYGNHPPTPNLKIRDQEAVINDLAKDPFRLAAETNRLAACAPRNGKKFGFLLTRTQSELFCSSCDKRTSRMHGWCSSRLRVEPIFGQIY